MGDNPCFYSCYFSFDFESRNLDTSVKTPLYLYLIAFFVPSKLLVGVFGRFGFLHRNRFLLSTVSRAIIRKQIVLIWNYLCVILRCIRNFRYFKVFWFEPRKWLETIRLYGLFGFDRFCLFFCILSFAVFLWFSLLQKASVPVANVPKCWLCLCPCWTCEFFIIH